jgi:hypothetical protein
MSIVIKTIGGRRYYYEQHSYRDGGKVKTISRYIGPVSPRRPDTLPRVPCPMMRLSSGPIGRQFTRAHGIDWVAIERDELARQKKEEEARRAFAEKMHALYGMNLTTATKPIEKPTASATISVAPSTAAQATADTAPVSAPEVQGAQSDHVGDATGSPGEPVGSSHCAITSGIPIAVLMRSTTRKCGIGTCVCVAGGVSSCRKPS